jgi:hypothetical protein
VGRHHQRDEHFGLVDHGRLVRSNGPILCPRVATVQIRPPACHSS